MNDMKRVAVELEVAAQGGEGKLCNCVADTLAKHVNDAVATGRRLKRDRNH